VHKYTVDGKEYAMVCSVGTVSSRRVVLSPVILLGGELAIIDSPSALDARTSII
jgi:hypothetical protein